MKKEDRMHAVKGYVWDVFLNEISGDRCFF